MLPTQDGKVQLLSTDFEKETPIFLIDYWLIQSMDNPEATAEVTYIGEYSNYQRNDSVSPFGTSLYQLTLDYHGEPITVAVHFPELFFDYELYWDTTKLATGSGSVTSSFRLEAGTHQLSILVSAHSGYYAGMYFPGFIATEKTVQNTIMIRTLVYTTTLLCSLILALFFLRIWNRPNYPLLKEFALMCLFFSGYLMYYFIHLWNLPLTTNWYWLEDVMMYLFLFKAVTLSLKTCQIDKTVIGKGLVIITLSISIIEVLLYFITPVIPMVLTLHGAIQNGYRLFIFLVLLLCSFKITIIKNAERFLILSANACLALGVYFNLVQSNQFEPIYTLWQIEWCGFFAVLFFAVVMVKQENRIVAEHTAFQINLNEMVEERTKQLQNLMNKRTSFFYDMAHDLKAPISATKNYIQMIQENHYNENTELEQVIIQMEKKQNILESRIQNINELLNVDRITSPLKKLSVHHLLEEVYHSFEPETSVCEIELVLKNIHHDCFILANYEKVFIVFENLIFNALRYTPKHEKIIIAAKENQENIQITISNNGEMIPLEDISHLFDRYFTRAQHEGTSGLGLYITKNIVEEFQGTIRCQSDETWTTFLIQLPVVEEDAM